MDGSAGGLLLGALAGTVASLASFRAPRLWLAASLGTAAAALAASLWVLVGGEPWDWRPALAPGGEALHLRLDGVSALRFASVFWVTPVVGGSFAPTGGEAPAGGGAGDGTLAQGPGATGGSGAGGAGARAGGLPPAGIESIIGLPADNSLVVRGTPAAIAELKSFLRLIDIPGRQVSVSIYALPVTTNFSSFGSLSGSVPLGATGRLRFGGR